MLSAMATAFLHHAARQDICTRVSQAFLDLLLRKVCRPPVGFSIMRNQLGVSIQCLPSFYFSLFLCKQSRNSLRNAGTLLQRYESCSKLNSASSGMVERMPVSRSACKPYTLGCPVAVRQGGTCWGCDCPLESHQPRSWVCPGASPFGRRRRDWSSSAGLPHHARRSPKGASLVMLKPQMWVSEMLFVWFGQRDPYLPVLSREPGPRGFSLCFCRQSRSTLTSQCDTAATSQGLLV